jgi:anthraniloyl-CoA monooxygenase
MWRNFPMIRTRRWVKDNIVLLGDAKATAHFSIGSGTKLAIEDAISLFESFQKHAIVTDALAPSRTPGATRWSARSMPPTCRWCGSSTSTGSGTWRPVQFAFG